MTVGLTFLAILLFMAAGYNLNRHEYLGHAVVGVFLALAGAIVSGMALFKLAQLAGIIGA